MRGPLCLIAYDEESFWFRAVEPLLVFLFSHLWQGHKEITASLGKHSLPI